jgi:hypothetical protein
MIHIPEHVFGDHSQRARSDLAASWEHLVSAAGHGAKQVGESSRRRGRVARDRTEAARLALLGELPPAPWRWLGAGLATGLAVGLVLGAAGATVLARGRREADQTLTGPATDTAQEATIRERANARAEAVREGTKAAVHGAAVTARDAAGKVRERLIHRDSAGELEPTEPVQPPSVPAPRN